MRFEEKIRVASIGVTKQSRDSKRWTWTSQTRVYYTTTSGYWDSDLPGLSLGSRSRTLDTLTCSNKWRPGLKGKRFVSIILFYGVSLILLHCSIICMF